MMPANYLVKCKVCGKPLGFAYKHEPGVDDALCAQHERVKRAAEDVQARREVVR